MVVVPATTPVTIPVVAPTVAIPVLLLVQLPPGVASVRVVVEPAQVIGIPAIATGLGFMVTVLVPVETQVPLDTDWE